MPRSTSKNVAPAADQIPPGSGRHNLFLARTWEEAVQRVKRLNTPKNKQTKGSQGFQTTNL